MASTSVGSIHYDLDLKTDKFDRSQSTIKSKLSTIGSGIAKVARAFTAVGVVAGVAGGFALKAWDDQEKAIAQTQAVLKSTKGAAGITAKAVGDLATKMQSVTTYADEMVQSGQNILLTFTNIGKDIFPQATETMLDMSTALGQDVKSSAIQLGKALQDPILGVTALRRVGVNFNQKQQDVIKRLVETGQAAKAQKLILKELKTEFGGSARAAAKTFGGQLAQLKNIFGELMEAVGNGLAKVLRPFVQKIMDWTNSLGGVDGITKQLSSSWDDFYKNTLSPTLQKIEMLAYTVGSYLGPKLEALWNTISKNLIPSLTKFWKEIIQPLLPVIGTGLVVAFGLATDALNAHYKLVSLVISFLAKHKEIVYGFAGAFAYLKIQMALAGALEMFNSVMAGVKTTYMATKVMLASPLSLGTLGIGLVIGALALVIAKFKETNKVLNDVRKNMDKTNAYVDKTNTAMRKKFEAGKISASAYRQYVQNEVRLASAEMEAANKRSKNLSGIKGFLNFITGKYAEGTNYHPGGMALVGERGPEIVNLPRGSQVIPNHDIKKMGGGGTVNLNIGSIHNQSDADYILRRLNVQQQALSMGVVAP